MKPSTPAQRARAQAIVGTFVAKQGWWMSHCDKCKKDTPHMDVIGGACEFCHKEKLCP